MLQPFWAGRKMMQNGQTEPKWQFSPFWDTRRRTMVRREAKFVHITKQELKGKFTSNVNFPSFFNSLKFKTVLWGLRILLQPSLFHRLYIPYIFCIICYASVGCENSCICNIFKRHFRKSFLVGKSVFYLSVSVAIRRKVG